MNQKSMVYEKKHKCFLKFGVNLYKIFYNKFKTQL